MELHAVRSEVTSELKALQDDRAEGGDAKLTPKSVFIPLRRLVSDRPLLPSYDDDGDLVLPRKRPRRVRSTEGKTANERDIVLEVMSETSWETSGSQLWRASLLLADFIHSRAALFQNARVLELGCGVGLVSLVAASVGADAIATDSDVTALAMCSRNAHGNLRALQGGVRVRHLDWAVLPQLTAPEAVVPASFLWTEDDQDSMSKLDMIVCSDVFYDDELTELLVSGLHALMLRFPEARVFITAERRVVFSMYTLSEIVLGYDTFQAHRCFHPSNLQERLAPSVVMCSYCGNEQAKERFIATNTPLDEIPHVFQYDRVSTLKMWEVKAVVTSRTDILV